MYWPLIVVSLILGWCGIRKDVVMDKIPWIQKQHQPKGLAGLRAVIWAPHKFQGFSFSLLAHSLGLLWDLWCKRENIRRLYGEVYTYIHYITLHYITLHYITLHFTTWHDITLHYTTLHYITLHYMTLPYITWNYNTFHYTTLHYIHYTTLHCITLHYTTLHYITYVHTSIHYITYIQYIT